MKQRIAMTALAAAVLPGAGMAAGPTPLPKLIGSYQAGSDADLPSIPSNFVRTLPFAFSPDEQWAAVVVHPVRTKGGTTQLPQSTLLLLPMPGSGKQTVRIELGPRVGVPCWSPGSDLVAIQAYGTGPDAKAGTVPKVYNLRGELVWTGPPSEVIFGFIEPGRLFASSAKQNGKHEEFDTLDIRTSTVTRWPAPRHWRIAAINPDRGLVAVFPGWDGSKLLIVDYATRKILRSIENPTWSETFGGRVDGPVDEEFLLRGPLQGVDVHFAENGKTLCAAVTVNPFQGHPICRDVDTGKTIAELQGFDGGAPADASSHGSRMALSESSDLAGSVGINSGSAIWDFRSRKEVAAWESPLRKSPG